MHLVGHDSAIMNIEKSLISQSKMADLRKTIEEAKSFWLKTLTLSPTKAEAFADSSSTLAPDPKPDDAILIDLMLDWAPNEAVRNRIFVDNAAKLYDFPKS
jgi:hypothetical protein